MNIRTKKEIPFVIIRAGHNVPYFLQLCGILGLSFVFCSPVKKGEKEVGRA